MLFKPHGFIKANRPFVWDYKETNLAPLFRRSFTLPRFAKAEIAVSALGLGDFYINGRPMTSDKHISPTSDYTKTVWYERYDVSALLHEGENCIACILGNGWYNESLKSCWEYREAVWRDNPKFALTLVVDGREVLSTDEQWKCCPESWITFNQLRSGEHADMRLYQKGWEMPGFDDSAWENAIADDQPPKGILREVPCQGVHECRLYPAKSVRKTGEKRYLFDLEQNISGYVRLRVHQKAGDVLTIRYFEQTMPDGTRKDNDMPWFYPDSPFQTDILTLSDEAVEYSPRFTYHGFHFIEIDGLDHADIDMVSGVFLHLDIEQLSGFECSNPDLNDLYRIGINACYSNMHYLLTDCPTREKYGWLNDARASTEHLLMDFDIAPFFHKWFQDIVDSVRESDGAIPGIAPTSGCEYDSYTGPICSCAMHEIAYKTFIYTGDDSLLIQGLPGMLHHLEYLKAHEDADGLIGFGLYDWAGPFAEDYNGGAPTPVTFTDTALYLEFIERTIFAAKRACRADIVSKLEAEYARIRKAFMEKYIGADGRCTVHEQTALAMMIGLRLYENFEPLKAQLAETVREHDFHMHTGMLGIRFLYDALNTCGLTEYAYRIVSAKGFPSYTQWLDQGATTAWETFYEGASKNHHMYTCFMLFLMDTLAGIRFSEDIPGGTHINIAPAFVEGLDWCRGRRMFAKGELTTEWRRKDGAVELTVCVPEGIVCTYNGAVLEPGRHDFRI